MYFPTKCNLHQSSNNSHLRTINYCFKTDIALLEKLLVCNAAMWWHLKSNLTVSCSPWLADHVWIITGLMCFQCLLNLLCDQAELLDIRRFEVLTGLLTYDQSKNWNWNTDHLSVISEYVDHFTPSSNDGKRKYMLSTL